MCDKCLNKREKSVFKLGLFKTLRHNINLHEKKKKCQTLNDCLIEMEEK